MYEDMWTSRSSNSPTLSVSGYDSKELIGTAKHIFPSGYKCDKRIISGTIYIVKTFRYIKNVQIDNVYSISIPPKGVIANYSPMGSIPGTDKVGYTISNLISSNDKHDTYQFYSEAKEITHNVSGQQIASLDNPIYLPCNAVTPHNFVFRYKVVEW